MNLIKKYGNALLALMGLAALFLPVNESGSAVGMLRRWKMQSMPLMLLLCVVLIATAAIVILNCYMEQRKAERASRGIAAICLIALLYLSMADGALAMPQAGGLICLAAMLVITVHPTWAQNTVYESVEEIAQSSAEEIAQPPAEEIHSSSAGEIPGDPARERLEYLSGRLKIFCGPFAGGEIELKHMESITIGRDASLSNVLIEDASVSRKHCTVTYHEENEKYTLVDTSANGTYLEGGQRIPKNFPMELLAGARFYVGKEENLFQLGGR